MILSIYLYICLYFFPLFFKIPHRAYCYYFVTYMFSTYLLPVCGFIYKHFIVSDEQQMFLNLRQLKFYFNILLSFQLSVFFLNSNPLYQGHEDVLKFLQNVLYYVLYIFTFKLSVNDFLYGIMLKSSFICDHLKNIRHAIFLISPCNSNQEVTAHTHLMFVLAGLLYSHARNQIPAQWCDRSCWLKQNHQLLRLVSLRQ